MKKRLLFIAYFYPPLGGPGVQRPLKTIKYLKDLGWLVDVLTVDDIQFHSYDWELFKESKADNIYRTKSLDLMSLYKRIKPQKEKKDNIYFNTPEKYKKLIRGLFPIDDKIGWYPFAYHKALELLRSRKYDAVVATIGPYTSGVLAYYLHKKTKIPFFIDYRDHWTLHSYPQYAADVLHKHAQNFEKKMLESANGVFVVNSIMRNQMISCFGRHLQNKIEVVYNGFDEDDFMSVTKPNSELTYIRYVGNFFGHRSIDYFIKALCELKDEGKIPNNTRFEFIGNYYIETLNLLKTEKLNKYINIIPQVEHPKAVNCMQTADLLLLFVPSAAGDDFTPGKVFEYIRANVPILAMIPENGEPAQILRKLGHKYICNMEDTESIKKNLICFLEGKTEQSIRYDMIYSRENQSKIFSEFIEKKLFDEKD